MGTKRPLDEDLQEFIKYPKHLENGNKPDSFKEDKHSFEGFRNVEISGEKVTISYCTCSILSVALVPVILYVDIFNSSFIDIVYTQNMLQLKSLIAGPELDIW